jgi:hypothetical protein
MPTPPPQLPSASGLTMMRLSDETTGKAWAGLLFYASTLTWPFDPDGRVHDDVDQLAEQATTAGLHPVDDPFTGVVPDADPVWSFRLPTLRRTAQLIGPGMILDVTRNPAISDHWWGLAVTHGSRCRLLAAAAVVFPDADAAAAAQVLRQAAQTRRLYGATISVEF